MSRFNRISHSFLDNMSWDLPAPPNTADTHDENVNVKFTIDFQLDIIRKASENAYVSIPYAIYKELVHNGEARNHYFFKYILPKYPEIEEKILKAKDTGYYYLYGISVREENTPDWW